MVDHRGLSEPALGWENAHDDDYRHHEGGEIVYEDSEASDPEEDREGMPQEEEGQGADGSWAESEYAKMALDKGGNPMEEMARKAAAGVAAASVAVDPSGSSLSSKKDLSNSSMGKIERGDTVSSVPSVPSGPSVHSVPSEEASVAPTEESVAREAAVIGSRASDQPNTQEEKEHPKE
ncbi:unnamed protein product, partial [Discosporangium mesarthrocarpum]